MRKWFVVAIREVLIVNKVSLGILTICPSLGCFYEVSGKRTETLDTKKINVFRILEMLHQQFFVKHLSL